MRTKIAFASALLIMAVDQFFKSIAPASPLPVIPGGGFFVRTLNHGIAFSLPVPSFLMALLLLVGLVGVSLAWRQEVKRGVGHAAPWTWVMAGAVSNIIDRIRVGAVIDYISIPFIRLNFNLADGMINTGFILIIFKNIKRHEDAGRA